MKFENSLFQFNRAQKSIPGGVNSPVRAFKSVNSSPIFIDSAKESYIYDIDGNRYIDFVASWGPMILGHANPRVINAIQVAATKGTSYGAPTILETELAELIKKMMINIEIIRMVNSGTEATMSAIRLARAYTKRDIIIKFNGCYHGHADSFLIKAGSGALTLATPDSPGVTKKTAEDTLIAEFNDFQSVEDIFNKYSDKIAAIILEPIPANMGVLMPDIKFLHFLREITYKHGSLLIFDEVITGFRISKGGAQQLFDIQPDITTLGKIIGGGLPVGAYGGRQEIMNLLAPVGPVYQAGTLSGNPLAMSAGLETLKIIDQNPNFYSELEDKSKYFQQKLQENIDANNIKAQINRIGSLMTVFFTDEKIVNSYQTAVTADRQKYAQFFKRALECGIYFAPSQFEAMFISASHTYEQLDYVINTIKTFDI